MQKGGKNERKNEKNKPRAEKKELTARHRSSQRKYIQKNNRRNERENKNHVGKPKKINNTNGVHPKPSAVFVSFPSSSHCGARISNANFPIA